MVTGPLHWQLLHQVRVLWLKHSFLRETPYETEHRARLSGATPAFVRRPQTSIDHLGDTATSFSNRAMPTCR